MMRFLDSTSPLPGILPILLATLLLFEVGYILTGIAIVGAGVLPRLAGVLLIAGVMLDLVPIVPVKMVAGLLFGIATVWIGVTLMGSGKVVVQSTTNWATSH